MAEIVLDKVTKRYPDGYEAVKDMDLKIEDGEFVILVGPSGCGKSTALRMIAGLEDITDGELRIGGEVVNEKAPKDRDIAMVFQNYALYPHMTVRENMGFALKLAKARQGGDRQEGRGGRARSSTSTKHLDRKPANLSGGQRQRVAMGRAIVRDPAAFLMDEPLSNLDAKLRVQMRTEVSRIQQRLGTTTVYVTHDQTEAMTLGDRVAVMRSGVLQQVGSPMELYNEPKNLFVAGFIGSPAMNFMPATLEGDTLKLPMADVRLPDELRQRIGQQGGELIAGHPAGGLRGRRARRRRQEPRRDLQGEDRGARVDGLRAVRPLLRRAPTRRSSPTSCASWPRTPARARCRARARRARSSRVSTRRARRARAQEAELWVDARTLQLFDAETARSLTRRPARRRRDTVSSRAGGAAPRAAAR